MMVMTAKADLERVRELILLAVPCSCYDPTWMEWDPDGPCFRCQALDLLDRLAQPPSSVSPGVSPSAPGVPGETPRGRRR